MLEAVADLPDLSRYPQFRALADGIVAEPGDRMPKARLNGTSRWYLVQAVSKRSAP